MSDPVLPALEIREGGVREVPIQNGMIRRILTLIFAPAVVAAVVTYAVTGLIPKTYSSYETLYFPLNPSGGLGALGSLGGSPSGGDAAAVSGLGGAIMYPLIASGSQTASGIINSHSCRIEVAQRLNLPTRWHTDLLKAAKELGENVTAESDKTGLLSVRVSADSPVLSVQINQEIYRYLRERTETLSKNVSSNNRHLIEQRLSKGEEELRTSEAKVVSALRDSPLAAVSDVQKNYLDAQKMLGAAKVSRDQQKARLDTLEVEYHRLAVGPKGTDSLNALTTLNPAFADLAQELERRRLELNDAMIAYSASNPRVYTARKAYENAEQISSDVKKGLTSHDGLTSPEILRARAEMAALEESVRSNESVLNESSQQVSSSAKQYAESAIAKDNFEAAMARVTFLKQELEKAAVIQNRDPSQFELIDEPFVDPVPIAPRRGLFALIAFFFVGGICFIPLLITLAKAVEAGASRSRLEAGD